ncbi:MAG: hypothetical protein CMH83_15240 [Nocardioides sp.]|nr:hypothetical protein [Nocardioides sp.]
MFNNVSAPTSAPRTPARRTTVALLAAAVAAATLLVSGAGAAPATAAPVGVASAPVASGAPVAVTAAKKRKKHRVASRLSVFDLSNTDDRLFGCSNSADFHDVRARLVGPRRVVRGYGGSPVVHVLVHDAGTGGWFWNLRGKGRYDYATKLARRGVTTLVLSRLGYDGSPLADGSSTCLQAQVAMLHQLVQHLYAGIYDNPRDNRPTVHAAKVVLQGHGTGATIAQMEAARYSDVAGVVMMSPADPTSSTLATRIQSQQRATCRTSDYAPFGATAATYRAALFSSAPTSVQRAAVQRRNPTPCGEVDSLTSATIAAATGGPLDIPVLLMTGGADERGSRTSVSTDARLTRVVVRGAGNALVLEKQAPAVRTRVLRWIGDTAFPGR